MSGETTLELLEALFVPGSATPDWARFVAALSRELEGAFCSVWSEQQVSAPVAAHPPEILEVLREWNPPERWSRARLRTTERPIGQLFSLDSGDEKTIEMYGELLRTAGLDVGGGWMLPLSSDGEQVNSAMIVHCPDGFAFEAKGRPLIEELTPWLVHAARSTLEQAEGRRAAAAMHGAIDRLRVGLILLQPSGEALYANRAAASYLEDEEAPFYHPGVASCERAARVQQGLDRLLEDRPRNAVAQDDARPRLIFSRLELDSRGGESLGGSVASAIFIADPTAESVEALRAVQQRYGLTPAETQLAALLVSDLSLEEAADRLGVTVGTVRTRLKQVFAKTDTHRQAALVRLLLAEGGQLYSE